MSTKKIACCTIVLFFLLFKSAYATHLKAGEIAINPTATANTYIIFLTLYLDSTSVANSGGQLDENTADISFGDGSPDATVPFSTKESIGNNTLRQTYTVTHQYSVAQNYTISYRQTNRNKYIVNIDGNSGVNSDNEAFYVEARLNANNFSGEVATPQFINPPLDHAYTGIPYIFKSSATPGIKGDSISYAFGVPKISRNIAVPLYVSPADAAFGGTNSKGNPATFKIDSTTGTITWDAPSGYTPSGINYALYVFDIQATEWRKNGIKYDSVGYAVRDIQVEVTAAPTAVVGSLSSNFQLFPNPAKDAFTLTAVNPSQANYTVNILDVSGKPLKEIKFKDNSKQIQLNDLLPGIYQLQVTDGTKSWAGKFVKE